MTWSQQHDDERQSVVCRSGFLQDQLFHRQVGHRTTQPAVLLLQQAIDAALGSPGPSVIEVLVDPEKPPVMPNKFKV